MKAVENYALRGNFLKCVLAVWFCQAICSAQTWHYGLHNVITVHASAGWEYTVLRGTPGRDDYKTWLTYFAANQSGPVHFADTNSPAGFTVGYAVQTRRVSGTNGTPQPVITGGPPCFVFHSFNWSPEFPKVFAGDSLTNLAEVKLYSRDRSVPYQLIDMDARGNLQRFYQLKFPK